MQFFGERKGGVGIPPTPCGIIIIPVKKNKNNEKLWLQYSPDKIKMGQSHGE